MTSLRVQKNSRSGEAECIQGFAQRYLDSLPKFDFTVQHLCQAYQTEIDSLTKRSKTSENAFLNVYKVLAEAPDPYPLLEAAVVRIYNLCLLSCLTLFIKDQTVKVAEALELEAESRRLREENVDLRRRVNDFSTVETSKKKLEARVEQLEQKVCPESLANSLHLPPPR